MAMNPYDPPRSTISPPEAVKAPPASRWAAALSGVLQGILAGAKWGMIVSAALFVLGGVAFIGLIAYRLIQEPNARLNMQGLATGVFAFVLAALISSVLTITVEAMLGAIIG